MSAGHSPIKGASAAARASLSLARAQARLGLSSCHISPRAYVRWSPRGALLELRRTGAKQCIVPKNQRGKVSTFSRRSRSRLLRKLASCDRSALSQSLLVTLTYPRSFATGSSTYKRHFDTWSKRLERRFPGASAIWKLEFQDRGAPHFHLIVMGVPFMARQWLSRTWFEVVKSDDPHHRVVGTQVQRVKSYRKALSYAAKYVAKLPVGESASEPGRFWGVIGRKNLPSAVLEWSLEPQGYARLARFVRSLARSGTQRTCRRRYRASWLFCHGERATEAVRYAAGL